MVKRRIATEAEKQMRSCNNLFLSQINKYLCYEAHKNHKEGI
jgi:hypothetical protein